MTPRAPSLPVPKTLSESVKYYEGLFTECLKQTQDVLRMYMDKREKLRNDHPDWLAGTIEEKSDKADVRIALLTKQINNFITTTFHLILYRSSLCNLAWLKENINSDYSSHLDVMEKQFDNCFKFAASNCFHGMFHLMESSFRVFIRHLDSERPELATASFQNIYSALFKILDIDNRSQRIIFMQFISVIRNGIHTNWVYMPSEVNAEPRDFLYRGVTYRLVPHKMMNFLTWKMIMEFAVDLLDLFEEVVSHRLITSLNEVHE